MVSLRHPPHQEEDQRALQARVLQTQLVLARLRTLELAVAQAHRVLPVVVVAVELLPLLQKALRMQVERRATAMVVAVAVSDL